MRRLLSIVLSVSAAPAFALPIFSDRANTQDFAGFLAANYDFEGTVQLSNCSGSLVRFEKAAKTDKALVLTNGHCVPVNGDLMAPGVFLSNVPVRRSFSLLSKDGQTRIGTVSSTRIIYATMTGTDAALYELGETYQEISDRYQVAPLTIASSRPTAGTAIEILSGYWRRGYGCKLDGFVYELREEGYTFTDSIRYEVNGGCNTIHGTSGSPILATGTRTVVGVNNTGNDDGESCTMNNPCEVDQNGNIFAQKGISYGQQMYQFNTCLNVQNQIDLSIPGCKLLKN